MSKKQQLLQRVVGGFAELVERGQVSQLMNPYTREPISRKHYLRDEEIFSKVTSTAQAYKCWREYKLERRIELVTALVNSVIKDRDQLKPIIAAEIGKSFRDIDREFDRIDRLSEKFIASGRENLREETVLNDVGKVTMRTYVDQEGFL